VDRYPRVNTIRFVRHPNGKWYLVGYAEGNQDVEWYMEGQNLRLHMPDEYERSLALLDEWYRLFIFEFTSENYREDKDLFIVKFEESQQADKDFEQLRKQAEEDLRNSGSPPSPRSFFKAAALEKGDEEGDDARPSSVSTSSISNVALRSFFISNTFLIP